MFLSRAYNMLLGLYPADFRAEFGGEMVTVFQQAATRERRGLGLLGFAAKEMLGLLAGAIRERAKPSDADRAAGALRFPTDIAGAERYLQVVSGRLIHAIAHHRFADARYYDVQDRNARALLAQLRAQSACPGEK